MRNLKKFLALVLAMMMVMGLMVTVNAKTVDEFDDAADVKAEYKEAIELMLALRAINGEDDAINPKGNLTRAQLAALLYTVNKGNNYGNDPVLAAMGGEEFDEFDDVRGTSSKWAVGYINYAAYYGWVNGRGAREYDPKGTVSVVEMMLAMLNVLGKSDTVLGGPNWHMDAVVAAQTEGITTGIDLANYRRAVTREEAFQIAFNAMKQDYATGTHYTVFELQNGEWVAIAKGTGTPNAAYLSDTSKYKVESRTITYTNSPLEDIYKLTSVNPSAGFDSVYGRPVKVYPRNAGDGGNIEIAIEPKATYNSGEFTGTAAKLDGQAVPAANKVDLYYNGVKNPADPKFDGSGTGSWVNDTTGVAGFEVEVYDHPDKAGSGKDYVVVIREAYLAQISDITDDGTIKLDVYKCNAGTPAKKWTYTIANNDANAELYSKLAGYRKGDYLGIYNQYDAAQKLDYSAPLTDILDVVDLVKETVTITQINEGTAKVLSSLVTDKGTYRLASEAALINGDYATPAHPGAIGTPTNRIAFGAATVYSINGCALLINQAAASSGGDTEDPTEPTEKGFGIVVNASITVTDAPGSDEWATGSKTATVRVRLLRQDGTLETYSMEAYLGSDTTGLAGVTTPGTLTATDWYVKVGATKAVSLGATSSNSKEDAFDTVYAYAADEDGYVTLTEVAAVTGSETASGKYLESSPGSITKGSRSVALTGATAIINSSTKFILSDGNNGYVIKGVSELGATEVTTGDIVVDVTKPESGSNTYVALYVFAAGTAFDAGTPADVPVDDYVFIDPTEKVFVPDADGHKVQAFNGHTADGDEIALTQGTGSTVSSKGVYTYSENGTVKGENALTAATFDGNGVVNNVTTANVYVTGAVTALAGDTIAIGSNYFTYTVDSEVIVTAGKTLAGATEVWAVVTTGNVIVALWVVA